MASSSISRHVGAGPSAVFRELLDTDAVEQWRAPDGTTARVLTVDGGTDVRVDFDGIPRGVATGDIEGETRMSLADLATLVEAARPPPDR
jgi:hypothetical protein